MFEAAYSQVSAPPGRILSIPDEGVACAISALLGQGWVLQVVTRGCRLTKSCPEYLPMVFELRLRWRSPRVYAGGAVTPARTPVPWHPLFCCASVAGLGDGA